MKDSNEGELTLMFDEMYIKKQVFWDQSKYKYVGYPTFKSIEAKEGVKPKKRSMCATKANNSKQTKNNQALGAMPKRVTRSSSVSSAAIENRSVQSCSNYDDLSELSSDDERQKGAKYGKPKKEKSPLATRAIVFMLSELNKSFEFPVAYHFVNGLGGDGLTELVTEVMMKVSEHGIKIANFTFDGAKDNLKMCENLGANLDPFSQNFKPFILNPYDGSVVYLIFDPSHIVHKFT